MRIERNRRVRFVRVDIARSPEGLYTATCSAVPSMLVIAKDADELARDIPASIEALWPHHYRNEKVEVLPAEINGFAGQGNAEQTGLLTLGNWAAVPAAA